MLTLYVLKVRAARAACKEESTIPGVVILASTNACSHPLPFNQFTRVLKTPI